MMMNHSPAPEAADSIDTYPAASDRATLSLSSLLQSEIEQNGAMPFDQWMAHCLYHPELGYYTKGDQRVGREGDFYTSISVGSCFGMILAHRIMKYADEHKGSAAVDLVETGANSGQLACDILDTLSSEAPSLYAKLRYTICEPLETMRQTQRQTLHQHASKLTHKSQLSDFTVPLPHGILISNELVDAFPVKLITKVDGTWLERCVIWKDEQFQFALEAISCPQLLAFTTTLPTDLPDGYETEYRPTTTDFATACSSTLEHGLVITIDYGHIHQDYYAPERRTGTLRTFHQHKAGEDPLENVGEQDITAHVDFSHLAQAFCKQGLQPSYFDTQTRYLTEHASSWFQSIEQATTLPSKLIRQFQTLTHPTMMGRQFHVLECIKSATPNLQVSSKLGIEV